MLTRGLGIPDIDVVTVVAALRTQLGNISMVDIKFITYEKSTGRSLTRFAQWW